MDTQYHPVALSEKKAPHVSVNSLFSRSSRSLPIFTTKKSRPKSWTWHILSHTVSFLWLAPIIALLVLNFKSYIIGASAWCPHGHCSSEAGGSSNAVDRAAKLDKNDHNLLGALQFVAKALEVWFMLIATALLFDLAMIMARMDGGLPVAYMLTHLEFGDIRNLFNPLLWTSPWPHRNATHSQKHRKSVSRLFIFGVLAALLTILTNLMGPATAVLVLPTLQWVDTPRKQSQLFQGLHLDRNPQEDMLFPACNASQLDAGNYSCTLYPHSASLDQFASAALATEVQWEQPFGTFAMTTSQESGLNFALNATTDGNLVWAPNRQALRFLTIDHFRSLDPKTYGTGAASLNESLQVILNRQAPSIGFQAFCNNGDVSVTEVADDKQIHCFSNYTQDTKSNYTKCFRVGNGFNKINKAANFWLGNSDPEAHVNSTAVDIYFSDSATYFNRTEDFGSGIKRCLSNSTAPSCDWDAIFANKALPPELQNMTTNVGVVSYSFVNTNASVSPLPGPQSRVYCDLVAYQSFPTYTLDTFASTNPLRLARMQGFDPFEKKRLVINPDWFLAAFSVNRNGTVTSNRKIAQQFSATLAPSWSNMLGVEYQEFIFLHLYALTQTFTMIPYDNTTLRFSSPASSVSGNNQPSTTTSSTYTSSDGHTLYTWASRHVWAYGINSSRTSKLGVTVVGLGGICVLIRLVLGAWLGKREHSPVELFVAALEHSSTGEFQGLDREGHRAKVRYMMEEDKDGKPRFVPERHWSSAGSGDPVPGSGSGYAGAGDGGVGGGAAGWEPRRGMGGRMRSDESQMSGGLGFVASPVASP